MTPRKRPVEAATPAEAVTVAPAPSLTFTVPYSAMCPDNDRFCVPNGRGRMVLTARYRKALVDVAAAAARAMVGTSWRMTDQAVQIEVRAFLPDKRVRDVSNFAKLAGDALSGYAYFDDVQIVESRFRKMGLDRDNPRVEITVTRAAA